MTYTSATCLKHIRMEGSILHMSLRTWWVNYSENRGKVRKTGDCIDVEVSRNVAVMEPPGFSITSVSCSNCGGSFDAVRQKICPYCGSVYHMENEGWVSNAKHAPLVIIQGMAGTAKTFYSLAVGLEKVYNSSSDEYRRIIVCRPNAQFDDDIGFLPGSEKEKIAPLMRPIIDNLEQILDSDEEKRYENEEELSDKILEIFERGIIQTEALNFIRGRSLVKTYLIIDEAQNMTPNQVKGIITRAGKDTKIILLGDPQQIDKPFLDEKTNGLSYAAKCMKGSPYCWQITLSADECERSALAMDAVQRL